MDLDGACSTPAVHLIGVSVPRSGHNLVVRLLQALFANDLFYCERYLVSGCCQTMPCSRRGTRRISFQKSHDLELDLPCDVADGCYVIQHRAPVPAILSAREKYAEEYGDAIADDRGAYAVWLGRSAAYLVAFHERWIARPPANGVVVDYDDLVRSPVDALRRIASAAGIEAADEEVQAAVARTVPRGGYVGECPFVPRSIDASRYLDRTLLAVFESIVIDTVPTYAPGRVLEPVEYQGTLVWYVFSALRAQRAGDVEEARRLLDEAIEQWPDNGMLLYEQSWLLLKQERYAEALRLLERSAALFPSHPPIVDLLVTAALAAGDVPAALEPMRLLATQIEPTLANRLRLAKVLAHNSDRAGAADILEEATTAAPQDALVWRDVSEVRLIRGELSEARLALEAAIRLAPLQADLYARHGDVLLMLGKPRRAVDALRQALALDPRQPASWTSLVAALRAADDRAGILQAVDEVCVRFPDDADLQAAMVEARRRALRATPPIKSSAEDRSSKAELSDGLARRFTGLVGRLPGTRRVEGIGQRIARRFAARFGSPGQREVQLAQLRAALGAAELRLAETEQRLRQEVETAWTQAQSLEGALQKLDASLREEVGQRAAGWTQARRLDAALSEQARSAEAAWAHARKLDAALAENARELQAARSDVRGRDLAIDEKDRELQALRLRLWQLEEALRSAASMGNRPATARSGRIQLG